MLSFSKVVLNRKAGRKEGRREGSYLQELSCHSVIIWGSREILDYTIKKTNDNAIEITTIIRRMLKTDALWQLENRNYCHDLNKFSVLMQLDCVFSSRNNIQYLAVPFQYAKCFWINYCLQDNKLSLHLVVLLNIIFEEKNIEFFRGNT